MYLEKRYHSCEFQLSAEHWTETEILTLHLKDSFFCRISIQELLLIVGRDAYKPCLCPMISNKFILIKPT